MRGSLRHVAGLALLSVACAAVTWSGAFLSSSEESNGSMSTGTLVLHGIDATAQLLEGPAMRPGQPAREAIATARNDGTLTGVLAVEVTDLGATTALAEVLQLSVDSCHDAVCSASDPVYDGPLADAGRQVVGELAPGASRRVRLRLSWPVERDDPALYGQTVSYELDWSLRDRMGP